MSSKKEFIIISATSILFIHHIYCTFSLMSEWRGAFKKWLIRRLLTSKVNMYLNFSDILCCNRYSLSYFDFYYVIILFSLCLLGLPTSNIPNPLPLFFSESKSNDYNLKLLSALISCTLFNYLSFYSFWWRRIRFLFYCRNFLMA